MSNEVNLFFSEDFCVDAEFFETFEKAARETGLRFNVLRAAAGETPSSWVEPRDSHPWATPQARANEIAAGNDVIRLLCVWSLAGDRWFRLHGSRAWALRGRIEDPPRTMHASIRWRPHLGRRL
jgi:hypothetical protein